MLYIKIHIYSARFGAINKGDEIRRRRRRRKKEKEGDKIAFRSI